MSTEDLLKPRYKVVADWPFCQFVIGDILVRIPKATDNVFAKEGWQPGQGNIDESYFQKYPHLFKKLEWWEERKPEDMPEYVVDSENPNIKYKVYGWIEKNSMFQFDSSKINITHTKYFLPATKEEYKK